jgi:hypothetical protein
MITIRQFCETLYCAYAPWEAFTAGSDERIHFTAFSQDREGIRFYRVEFVGVRGFRWQRDGEPTRVTVPPRRELDDRLEISALEVEREGDYWRFWCHPWYTTVVEFRCAGIRLNGATVSGTGRWLQDDLPAVSPTVPAFPDPEPTSIAALLDLPGAA